MARKARVRSKSGIYHIMLRGANRQEIFHDDEDRVKLMGIMVKYKELSQIVVYAWCLMSNHVHLLIKEGNEPISNTMKRIGVSYVLYYNRKYQASGHLFQDRFKSEVVESDSYLLTVVRYIHQNPLKVNIVKKSIDWQWSSCRGYYGEDGYPKDLLDSTFVLKMFSENESLARGLFVEFNERVNDDECLDDRDSDYGLSDDAARGKIRQVLGNVKMTQIKSMPKKERDECLRKVKGIKGVSQRQAARILGVAPTLMFKA